MATKQTLCLRAKNHFALRLESMLVNVVVALVGRMTFLGTAAVAAERMIFAAVVARIPSAVVAEHTTFAVAAQPLSSVVPVPTFSLLAPRP
jgi:hypothetical protein